MNSNNYVIFVCLFSYVLVSRKLWSTYSIDKAGFVYTSMLETMVNKTLWMSFYKISVFNFMFTCHVIIILSTHAFYMLLENGNK